MSLSCKINIVCLTRGPDHEDGGFRNDSSTTDQSSSTESCRRPSSVVGFPAYACRSITSIIATTYRNFLLIILESFSVPPPFYVQSNASSVLSVGVADLDMMLHPDLPDRSLATYVVHPLGSLTSSRLWLRKALSLGSKEKIQFMVMMASLSTRASTDRDHILHA